MFSFFKKVDDFIFDMPVGIQVIANVVERSTGLKHYNQARIVAVLTTAWVINVLGSRLLVMINKGEIASDVVGAMIWNLSVILLVFVITRRAQASTAKGFRNALREPGHEVFFRMLHVFMIGASSWRRFVVNAEDGVLLNHVTFIGLTLCLYLAACDEAPPVHRTVPQT